jgi:NAD(P)-dependent dehydrogenase (short-subunit alcohol dehydrogenase family)
MKFQGIVCIITGGSGGLGEATTKRLLELGAKVMIFDLQEPKDEFDIINCLNLSFQRVDITDEKQVQIAIETTVRIFGKVNVLINCAGIGYIESTITDNGTHDYKKFINVLNINLVGTFICCKYAAYYMKENPIDEDNERGVIINVASIAAMEGTKGQIAYAASKGGIVGMSMPMARDLGPYKIRVATIAPGPIDTGISMASYAHKLKDASVLKRFGYPKEFAMFATHIIENPYIVGSVLRLDGGLVKPDL